MTSLLRNWLKDAQIEWDTNNKLEEEFCNGYLIGKLICNLQIGGLSSDAFQSEFVNDATVESMTQNYKLISKYLCDGGMDIKPKLLRDIADQVQGAIHRFIYDLKCFTERIQNQNHQAGEATAAAISVGLSSPRTRKHVFEDLQKRDVELKIRKLATEQFHLRSELKWQKYKDHAIKLEREANMAAQFEHEVKTERAAQLHDTLVHTLKQRHQTREELDGESKQKWELNQRIKQKRDDDKVYFEQSQNLKQLQTIQTKTTQNAQTTAQSIDEFEDILCKTQKLQKQKQPPQEEENCEIAAAEAKEQKEKENKDVNASRSPDALQYLEQLRRCLPDQTVSAQKTQQYMEQIKLNVARQKQDALQRENRRKKMISDQMSACESRSNIDRELELKKLDTAGSCSELDEKLKFIQKHRIIFKQNANLMKQKKYEQQRLDERTKLQRDAQHFRQTKIALNQKQKLEVTKLQQLKRRQQQHEHAENTKYCKRLAVSMIDVTYKCVLYRKLADTQQPVPDALWHEWMQLLLPPTQKPSFSSFSVLQSKSLLDKDKECHTQIAHIQREIMQCMDVTSSLNRALINATELKQYLSGTGIWSYEADETEPSTQALGVIVQEIIAVSEGPDARHQSIVPEAFVAIALMGKPFVGKSTHCQSIADKYALQVIEPQRCVQDAIASYQDHANNNACADGGDADGAAVMSTQQALGQKLQQTLAEGKEVSDELYVDVIADAIQNVKSNGYILDGFPIRLQQAQLLEAKLSGYQAEETSKNTKKLSKKNPSQLAPPSNVSNTANIESGLDLVVYLDVQQQENDDSDNNQDAHEVLLERAKGRLVDRETGRVYHATQSPPPMDECIKERLTAPSDEAYVAGLPEYFKAFDDRKDTLKTWFDKFGGWVEVDCNETRPVLTASLVRLIEEKVQKKKENEDANKDAAADDIDDAAEEKSENIQPEPDQEQDVVDEQNEFDAQEQPLKDESMCRRLHFFWNDIEQSFIETLCSAFDLLRNERRRMLAYLASIREYFYAFLNKADEKQTLIDEFQRAFNDLPMDMRRDDDTKNELHQRTQDLSFALFQQTMNKKNDSIAELENIRNSAWFESESDTLLQVVVSVIHTELNRYLASTRMMTDYFALKQNESIAEEAAQLAQPLDFIAIVQETQSEKNIGCDAKLQKVIELALKYAATGDDKNDNNASSCNGDSAAYDEIIECEHKRLSMRMDRLKLVLADNVQDLNQRHQDLMQKLDQWIALRIESENTAIETLVRYVQRTVEEEKMLHHRLVMEGENLLIDEDVVVYPMPDPIQHVTVNHDIVNKGAFTASQLINLIEVLQAQNACGIIEYASMSEILQNLAHSAYAQNEAILPEVWKSVNEPKVYLLLAPFVVPTTATKADNDESQTPKYVNWKLFVLSLMLHTLSVLNDTVTIPSLDTLFELKQAFLAKDVAVTGRIEQPDFNRVLFWFDGATDTVWHRVLWLLFGGAYNTLLYHLCFNDRTQFGFEKIAALTQNTNLLKAATGNSVVTEEQWRIIHIRGSTDVDITITEERQSVAEMESNDAIISYFKCVSIEPLLQ